MIVGSFIAPTPNCGHGGTTFTHDVVRDLWLCPKCLASLGGLMPRCTGCGGSLPLSTAVSRLASRTCFSCQRNSNDERRAQLNLTRIP